MVQLGVLEDLKPNGHSDSLTLLLSLVIIGIGSSMKVCCEDTELLDLRVANGAPRQCKAGAFSICAG